MSNKKYPRIMCAIAMAAVMLLSLASCSSKNMSMDNANSTVAEYEIGEGYYAQEEPTQDSDYDYSVTQTNGNAQNNGSIERKIIKNGDMSLTSDDVNAAYNNLLSYVKKSGGYEYSCTFSEDQYDNSAYIEAVFKLPPDKLSDVMHYAGSCAKIVLSSTNSDDVTNEYYDYKTRLNTLEKSLESYYALLEKAQTTEAIIAIQKSINDLTVEIESIKGQIKLYDNLTSEATLNVSLSQTPSIVTEDVQWDSISLKDMGRLSSNGFISVVNGIWSVLQWLIIILISISPILLIAAIIVVVIVVCVKASSKKKAKKAQDVNNEINMKYQGKKDTEDK